MSYQIPPTVVQSATVTLTSAQFKALLSAPVQMVPAPGAGKYVFPQAWEIRYSAGAIPYQPVNSQLSVGTVANPDYASFNLVGLVDQASSHIDASTGFTLQGATTDFDNAALFCSLSTPSLGGPITVSVLNQSGDGYAIGDTGIVLGGNDDALYVVDTVSAGGSGAIFQNGALNQAGDGYVIGDSGVISGGNGDAAYEVDSIGTGVGAISQSATQSGGSNYAPGDTGTINGGNGDAVYVVDTVINVLGVDVVATYHLTNTGTGYTPGVASTTPTSGVGFLFSINITAVTGTVSTYHLTSAGTGYSTHVNSSTTISSGIGNGVFTVDIVVNRPIASYHLTNAGTAYSTGASAGTSVSTGAGNGATIDVTASTVGDGTVGVAVQYAVVDVS